MTKSGALMVCGTASDVGKSQIVTALCRLLARRGVRVAPFKGQNMALNSYVTESGHEIGRSQALQAWAARVTPEVEMNPVLLKPTTDRTSQVVVMGRPTSHCDAAHYQSSKQQLFGVVCAALESLRARFGVVVLEGAGSPAEPNLMSDDLVNLGLAQSAGIPAILVGDIERGGVFAALCGTMALLSDDRRKLVGGFVINKFRGDPQLLQSALHDLENRLGVPCLGVLPHAGSLDLDAEDSLALVGRRSSAPRPPVGDDVDIAVCRFPHLSNFTDVDPLVVEPGVEVRFVDRPSALGRPDLVILPGSKCTVDDLDWLRVSGLGDSVSAARREGSAVLGICAGYQMLGRRIIDEVESGAGEIEGFGWLPVSTRFRSGKVTRRRRGAMGMVPVTGYEIRHGSPEVDGSSRSWFELDDVDGPGPEGLADPDAGVWGTSLHGLFEEDSFRVAFLRTIAHRRGKRFVPSGTSFYLARERQIDRMADLVEAHTDLAQLWELIERGSP
jgi:adenosylcobyric acid synthase